MSEYDPEDALQPEIISAEPTDATIEAQEAAYLGTVRVYVNKQLFYTEGDARLTELARQYGFKPPRGTDDPHVDLIGGSFGEKNVRT